MQSVKISENLKKDFQNKLLSWYKKNNRNFSWRSTTDPYETAVAEIMLQKTQAEDVEKVYTGFLKKYPHVDLLIDAPDDEIIKNWKNLGLQNQKLRTLKDLAEKVVKDYGGKFPSNKEDLLCIKGVGEYIAGAILCFAFNKRVSIIDGNILRILNRLFGVKSSKKNPRTDKEIWSLMDDLLPTEKYKEFNYALLDFAKLICKIHNPACQVCFMVENCHYFRTHIKKFLVDI